MLEPDEEKIHRLQSLLSTAMVAQSLSEEQAQSATARAENAEDALEEAARLLWWVVEVAITEGDTSPLIADIQGWLNEHTPGEEGPDGRREWMEGH